MIRLDYRLSPKWISKASHVDFGTITRFELDTSIFSGDQVFVVNSADFSFIDLNIPLLEYARSLFTAVQSVSHGMPRSSFHPLDEDADTIFDRFGETIRIQSSITDAVVYCGLNDLVDAVDTYCSKLLSDFLVLYPDARGNKALKDYFHVSQLDLGHLFTRLPPES